MNFKFLFALLLTLIPYTVKTIPTARDILFAKEEDLASMLKDGAQVSVKAILKDSTFDPSIAPGIWNRHPFFNSFTLTERPASAYPAHYKLLCPELKNRLAYLQEHPKEIPSLDEVATLAKNCITYAEEMKKKLGPKIFYNQVDLDDMICSASEITGLSLTQLKPVFGALCFTKFILMFFIQLAMSAVEYPETPSNQNLAANIIEKYEGYLLNYIRNASAGNEATCEIHLEATTALAQATFNFLS